MRPSYSRAPFHFYHRLRPGEMTVVSLCETQSAYLSAAYEYRAGLPKDKEACATCKTMATDGTLRALPAGKSLTLIQMLRLAFEGRCAYCGQEVAPLDSTIDHIVPKSRGGTNAWDNLALACRSCNGAKGDRMPDGSEIRLIRSQRAYPAQIRTVMP